MEEFLKVEYEECLSLLKYYDERHLSLVKFASGLSSGIPALVLAVYQLKDQAGGNFWPLSGLIFIATAVSLLTLFTAIIQTRLYFIYPARQVNAIRRHCLANPELTFSANQMYLDTTFNAFKWSSTQSLLQAFVALQTGAFASLASFSFSVGAFPLPTVFRASAVTGIVVAFSAFALSARYLFVQSQKHPDTSIHGRMERDG